MKFRKKPVVIEAVQWTGKNHEEIARWAGGACRPSQIAEMCLSIRTLEGDMQANPGDWIIKGVAGEFYPCKPSIFEATYEVVE